MSTSLTAALELAYRRTVLSNYTPSCPKCGASKFHMQLVNWQTNPAEWKCRTCKYKFLFEPFKK